MAFENMNLGRRVARRMAQLGINQVQLAEMTGISQGRISHIRLGRIKMVEAPSIFKLADALQCDPRWLATGELVEVNEE